MTFEFRRVLDALSFRIPTAMVSAGEKKIQKKTYTRSIRSAPVAIKVPNGFQAMDRMLW